MYFEYQTERQAQLEQQRLTFTSIIVTISVLAFTLAFDNDAKLNAMNGILLPIVIIFANFVAIIYTTKSRAFIKLHQERRAIALKKFSPALAAIDKEVDEKRYKPNFEPKEERLYEAPWSLSRRQMLQNIFHGLIIVVAIATMLIYVLPIIIVPLNTPTFTPSPTITPTP
jgi:uncharacterized membrane protein YbhN (UPF0104 family)